MNPPDIDYEYLHDQLGTKYDFQSIWDEKEERWFVEAVRIHGYND